VPVRIKICGITSVEDALTAVEAGADALGFNFAMGPRRITPEEAAAIAAELPPFVATVGLVVDQDPAPILEVCRLDVIQFHGSEPPETVAAYGRRALKVFRIRAREDLDALSAFSIVGAFLLDAYVPGVPGGTGHRFPWELAVEAKRFGKPILVAGGLTPENVAQCVAQTRPYGVDVSTGVESAPGRKDPARVRDFVAAARSAGRSL
jgi:phosphoribosylanthranilate isomerase